MTEPNKRISELTKTAIQLSEVDHTIPFKRYLRASKEIMRTADYYYHDHQLEQAFILYSKYCTLFVEKFPKHPEYKTFCPADKKAYSLSVKDSFKKAEALKHKLLVLFTKEHQEKLRTLQMAESDVEEREKDGGRKGGVVDEKGGEGEKRRMREEEMRLIEERFRNIKTQAQSGLLATPSIPQTVASAPPEPQELQLPAFDRSLKPSSTPTTTPTTTTPTSTTTTSTTKTAVEGLRNVIMPSNVAVAFLNAVKANSDNNVETCGILLGDLKQKKWKVSRLLLPQQLGGSDNCDISNEEEIVAYQDTHNLITLGWIHTHPSQTAFLSSVDQHTHWPYQKFFPEAIAVVCSPKFNQTGYFNLTHEGMSYIGACKGRGFHQHPSHPPMFQSCGHVEFDVSCDVILHDLRR